MPEAPDLALQDEVNQKLADALFPGQVAPRRPSTQSGWLAWVGELGAGWFLLILAIANLGLALFDYSYLDFRHLYLHVAPSLVHLYDPVKGVSPHRTTDTYNARADVALAGSALTEPMLAEMRDRSAGMIQEDPFAPVGLSGVFEHAKNRMRRHMHEDSSKKAFARFWSAENLTPARIGQERQFYDAEIRPLVARNYFRGIGENGRPFDAFWLLDALFIPFFGLEFVLRGRHAIKTGQAQNWKAFAFTSWSDLAYFVPIGLYLVPFEQSGWVHLLRAISVGNRLSRLGLFNPIAFTQSYTNGMVDVITDLVSVKLIGNYQESIRAFTLADAVKAVSAEQQAAMRRIVERHLEGVVLHVLPEMAQEMQDLVTYSARKALEASPAYARLRQIPFLGSLPDRYLPDLVAEVLSGTQQAMARSLQDPQYRGMVDQAIAKATALVIQDLERFDTENEVKALIIDVLEQQKKQLLA